MPWLSGGFSLSKTWNVARLTSEISSSVRINRRALSCDGTFVAGAVADAAPVIARETPAAPHTKAVLPRFLLELRLACVMVDPPRQRFDQGTSTSCSALRHEPARCRFGSRFWLHTIFRRFTLRRRGGKTLHYARATSGARGFVKKGV